MARTQCRFAPGRRRTTRCDSDCSRATSREKRARSAEEVRTHEGIGAFVSRTHEIVVVIIFYEGDDHHRLAHAQDRQESRLRRKRPKLHAATAAQERFVHVRVTVTVVTVAPVPGVTPVIVSVPTPPPVRVIASRFPTASYWYAAIFPCPSMAWERRLRSSRYDSLKVRMSPAGVRSDL